MTAKKSPSLPFVCLECGKPMSFASAERAMNHGCPKCGGFDVDLNVGRSMVKAGAS